MRTDVKVGVAVGLLLVIGVVTYYAIFDRSNQGGANGPAPQVAGKPAAGQVDSAVKKDAPGKSPDVVLPHFGARTTGGPTISVARAPARPEPVAPVTPAVAALPTIATPTTPPPSSPEPVVTPSVSVRTAPPSTPEPVAAAPSIQDTPSPATPVAAVPAPEPPVTPSMSEPAPVAEPVAPKIRETPIVPAGPSVSPKIRETPGTPVIRETPGGRTGVTPPVPATPGAETVYEVKKGDSGFWAIAEKIYGDGKYWPLIAHANPGVESSSLVAGKKLKIPAKPVAAAPTEPTRGAAGGVVTPVGVPAGPAAAGKGEYVVKKGDAGFWGIAQTVYGNGKYWALIAKANPKVSSSGLKIGDKLIIPPKPESATTKPAADTVTPGKAGGGTGFKEIGDTAGKETPIIPGKATGGTVAPVVVPGPGQKVYVVDKSDATGLWGIAKKVYGDGKHWETIAKANPKVDATALKAGQQLIIPELGPQAHRSTATSKPAPATPSAPAAGSSGSPRIAPKAAPKASPKAGPKAGPKDVEDLGSRPTF